MSTTEQLRAFDPKVLGFRPLRNQAERRWARRDESGEWQVLRFDFEGEARLIVRLDGDRVFAGQWPSHEFAVELFRHLGLGAE